MLSSRTCGQATQLVCCFAYCIALFRLWRGVIHFDPSVRFYRRPWVSPYPGWLRLCCSIAFKCFRCADLLPILAEVRSLGADFDMELLLCALTKFSAERKGPDEVLCDVSPTLFTEDFAESNFMASADDEDKPCVT